MSFFLSSGVIFHMALPNGSIPGITPVRRPDAVPVEPMSSGALSSSTIAADATGCMTRPCAALSPLMIASAGVLGILVEQRLSIAAYVVREARRHAKTAVQERGGRCHRQRIHLGCADRRRRIRLKDVFRVPRHAHAIREIDHVLDARVGACAHRGRVARLAQAIRQLISPRYCGSDREWKFSIFLAPRPRPSDTKIGASSTLQRSRTWRRSLRRFPAMASRRAPRWSAARPSRRR